MRGNNGCFPIHKKIRFEFLEIFFLEFTARTITSRDILKCRAILPMENIPNIWFSSRNFRFNGSHFGKVTIFGFSGNVPRNFRTIFAAHHCDNFQAKMTVFLNAKSYSRNYKFAANTKYQLNTYKRNKNWAKISAIHKFNIF